jgi:hypothetical protein
MLVKNIFRIKSKQVRDLVDAWNEIEETITSFNELSDEELIECKSSLLSRLEIALCYLGKYVPTEEGEQR